MRGTEPTTSPGRIGALVILGLVVIGLAIAPGAVAICNQTVSGSIVLPTGKNRPLTLGFGNELIFFRIPAVNPGSNFTLEPEGGVSQVGTGGSCPDGTGLVCIPDFDVLFFTENGCASDIPAGPVGTATAGGSEAGRVPASAACAIVIMAYGPSLSPVGLESPFIYRDGCTGE